MSEAYPYGEGLKRQRLEYQIPSEVDREQYMGLVSDELEALFMSAPSSNDVHSSFYTDENELHRSVRFVYNSVGDEVKVVIENHQYADEILREHYTVRILRSEAGVKGDFMNEYQFSCYVGDHWQAHVQHLDVENDNWNVLRKQNNSKYYSREMTPYDFDEFFKDTAQINTQLRMRLVQ